MTTREPRRMIALSGLPGRVMTTAARPDPAARQNGEAAAPANRSRQDRCDPHPRDRCSRDPYSSGPHSPHPRGLTAPGAASHGEPKRNRSHRTDNPGTASDAPDGEGFS